VVADRTQGKPKPIGEAEKMPGTGEVTRDFFIIQEVNGEGKVILREPFAFVILRSETTKNLL